MPRSNRRRADQWLWCRAEVRERAHPPPTNQQRTVQPPEATRTQRWSRAMVPPVGLAWVRCSCPYEVTLRPPNTETTCEAPSLALASAGSSRCWTAPSSLLHAKLTHQLLGLLFAEALHHFLPQPLLPTVLLFAPRQLGHLHLT